MQKLLAILDSNLKTKRPDFYSKLNPALTGEQISELENKFHFTLPDALKEIYKWKNGQRDDCYSGFISNSMFMPLENVFRSKEIMDGMIGYDFEIENWWNKNWFPIFDNGSGDTICYDNEGIFTGQQGQMLEFRHADNDRNVIFPDLFTFFEAIVKCYDGLKAEKHDSSQFCDIQSPEGFPKKFIVE
jgi:cell wall assembly regulator SMI1